MKASATFVVPGSAEGIRQAEQGLDAFLATNALTRNEAWPFHVALDELLSNVVNHGLAGRDGAIEIQLRLGESGLEMVVTDDAPPFDPLAAPEVDTSAGVEERPIGGLGILVVRKLMESVTYERVGERNRLTLRRKLGL
jgi:serine/threonine-protein kinase RsbW